MADNVTPEAVVSAASFKFATDEVSIGAQTVQVPRTKIGYGADGTYVGDVATDNPFPIQLRASAGTEIGTSGAPVRVDPTGSTAQPVTGTFWQATQPVSAASLPLPTGAATEAKQDTGNASLALIEGKITACNTGAVVLAAGSAAIGKLVANAGVVIGAVEVTAGQTIAATQSGTWNIGTVTTVTTVSTVTTCSTVTTLTGSAVAHDGADSGNPHKIGFKATTSLAGLTLVADADRTDARSGIDGVQITRPHCNLEDIVSGVASITDGSSTSVIASQGAGVKTYITSVIIANTSATAVTVDLRDGAAGTVKATFPVPANTSGVVHALQVPIPFSAATAVCADPSAAASAITVTLIGFKSKV